MNGVIKEAAEKVIVKAINSGTTGIREVVNVYLNDYQKRINTHFGFKESIKGAFRDTRLYCNDVMCGKEPRIMQEAVIFEDE